MEDFLLVEKSHDCKERDVTETVLLTENIPLTKLKASDGIYMIYVDFLVPVIFFPDLAAYFKKHCIVP